MKPDISVIIPVYNVGAYIAECLSSIVRQHFDGTIEAILIDDQSTDNSKAVCMEYVHSHPELFRYYAQPENRGVSAARNLGLSLAKGEFYCFVDSDDKLPSNALQTLYNAAVHFDVDIVKGSNTVFDRAKSVPANYNAKHTEVFAGDSLLTILLGHKKVRGHSWGKLFRSSRFNDYQFPQEYRMAEDLAYCVKIFSAANSMVIIPDTVYHYRLRPTGAARSKYRNGSYKDWLDVLVGIESYISSPRQNAAYYGLLVRSVLEIVNECRALARSDLTQVLKNLTEFKRERGITLLRLIVKCRVPPATLIRYIKFVLKFRALNKR